MIRIGSLVTGNTEILFALAKFCFYNANETRVIKEHDAETVVTVETFDPRDERVVHDLIVRRGRSTRTEHRARDLRV